MPLGWGSLCVRYTFTLGDWSITPALGARIFRTAARATGFSSTEPEQVRWAPAGVASLEAERSLWRGLFVAARLSGYVRQPQNLTINGLSERVGRIGAAGASLSLAAGWRFF